MSEEHPGDVDSGADEFTDHLATDSSGTPVLPTPTDVASSATPSAPLSLAEFELAVSDALDFIPGDLLAAMDNVVVLVEDEPPPGEPDVLGLYDGVPLTERDGGYSAITPDIIRIFRGPLTRMCESREELVDEIAVTVVHEIAHHMGIDEDRIHELGWG